jgi:hypothetical protein
MSVRGGKAFLLVAREQYGDAASALLLDHLVGAGEQRGRHVDAEHECRLRVDDELELGRLHDR